MADKDFKISIQDLPKTFNLKYLGKHPAKGLWGLKHTRKPVENLVNQAKNLPKNTILPLVQVTVTTEGMHIKEQRANKKTIPETFTVDSISYGVQDIIFGNVFSIIVVTGTDLTQGSPFFVHSFLCANRNEAKQLTYALAAVFDHYGDKLKENDPTVQKRKFTIDLRTTEEHLQSDEETEA